MRSRCCRVLAPTPQAGTNGCMSLPLTSLFRQQFRLPLDAGLGGGGVVVSATPWSRSGRTVETHPKVYALKVELTLLLNVNTEICFYWTKHSNKPGPLLAEQISGLLLNPKHKIMMISDFSVFLVPLWLLYIQVLVLTI